jgi:hypothetical protein
MAKKRQPDFDRDLRGNVMRAVRTALWAVFDLEDRKSVPCEDLARVIADAVYDCAEEHAIKRVWAHEHKYHGVE